MSRADRFVDKVVIVTGAAQGIGRGVAIAVAAEGGAVLGVDRSDLIGEVVAEITAAGGKAAAFQADLETFAGAQAMVAEALAKYKRVDILINNVGGTIWTRPYDHYEEQQIEKRDPAFAVPHLVELPRGAAAHGREQEGRDRQRLVDRHPQYSPGSLRGGQGRRQRADRVARDGASEERHPHQCRGARWHRGAAAAHPARRGEAQRAGCRAGIRQSSTRPRNRA